MSSPQQRPIRFGFQLAQERVAWPQLLEGFLRIEEMGFDSAWTHDHFIPADPGARQGPCLGGWTCLAALAARTSRIRLGVLVSGNTYRHPAVLAKMATTIDHISGGRLEMGLGAGWYQEEHDAYGIPFFTLKERMDRLEEACRLLKALWTQDGPSNLDGRFYSLKNAPFDPRPVQQPHPPIWIGGGGERRTLAIAARYADVWNAFGSPAVMQHKIDVLAGHCRRVGRNPDDIEKSVMTLLMMTESPQEAEQVVQGIAQSRGAPPEMVHQSILVGTPDDIRARLQEYVSVGVTHIVIPLRAPYPFAMLERFAREVIPAFRR